MVVLGSTPEDEFPNTFKATSVLSRRTRPGLGSGVLNIHKPADRSHLTNAFTEITRSSVSIIMLYVRDNLSVTPFFHLELWVIRQLAPGFVARMYTPKSRPECVLRWLRASKFASTAIRSAGTYADYFGQTCERAYTLIFSPADKKSNRRSVKHPFAMN